MKRILYCLAVVALVILQRSSVVISQEDVDAEVANILGVLNELGANVDEASMKATIAAMVGSNDEEAFRADYSAAAKQYYGVGVNADRKLGYEAIAKAADGGYKRAIGCQAYIISRGAPTAGGAPDLAKGCELARQSGVAEVSPYAALVLARAYAEGVGVERSSSKSAEWRKKAYSGLKRAISELQDPIASFVLGRTMLEEGDVEGLKYIESSSESGVSDATTTLALIYLTDRCGIRNAIAVACNSDGMIYPAYEKGEALGIAKNRSKGLALLRQGVEQGNVDAITALGAFYLFGVGGVEEDKEKGKELLSGIAGKAHSSEAATVLGNYYVGDFQTKTVAIALVSAFGGKVEDTPDEYKPEPGTLLIAGVMLSLAADMGDPAAMYSLSCFPGFEEAKRAEWKQKAADAGCSQAKKALEK